MPINLPVPQNMDYGLFTLLKEICRRAIDGSINPIQINVTVNVTSGDIKIATAGNGLILTTRDGLHTYRILMDNDGAIAADQLT